MNNIRAICCKPAATKYNPSVAATSTTAAATKTTTKEQDNPSDMPPRPSGGLAKASVPGAERNSPAVTNAEKEKRSLTR